MSAEVVSYQIAIALAIIVAATLIGRWGMFAVAAIAAIWTIVMVFTKWLFILQFVTIVISMFLGALVFSSEKFNSVRSGAWQLILIGGVAGWFWWKNRETPPAPAPAVTINQGAPAYPEASRAAPPLIASNNDPQQLEAQIKYVEQRYSELNARSPDFDQQLTDAVIARQRQLMDQSSLPAHVALRNASDEVMKRYYDLKYSASWTCHGKDGSSHPPPCKSGETRTLVRGSKGVAR